MIELLLAALTFGLTAGLKPGPLSIFVIHQTLSHGVRTGFIASLAPFVSDGPIIAASYLLVSYFGRFEIYLAVISMIGAVFLAAIALRMWLQNQQLPEDSSSPSSFFTAVKINLLNPAPYIFWGTVGGAYMAQNTLTFSLVFVLVFLASLSLSKTALAASIHALGKRFSQRAYDYLLKSLAIFLLAFSAKLLMGAFEYF